MSKDRTPSEIAWDIYERNKCLNPLTGSNWIASIEKAILEERTRSAEKDAEIAKLRGELQSQSEVMEKMREALENISQDETDGQTGPIRRSDAAIIASQALSRLEKKDGD